MILGTVLKIPVTRPSNRGHSSPGMWQQRWRRLGSHAQLSRGEVLLFSYTPTFLCVQWDGDGVLWFWTKGSKWISTSKDPGCWSSSHSSVEERTHLTAVQTPVGLLFGEEVWQHRLTLNTAVKIIFQAPCFFSSQPSCWLPGRKTLYSRAV